MRPPTLPLFIDESPKTMRLIRSLEAQPCACGKRQTSEPQRLVGPVTKTIDINILDVRYTERYSLKLQRGICNHIHMADHYTVMDKEYRP